MFSHIYGQYVPENGNVASFFGTLDEAYNDIKIEVRDLIELN